MNSIAGALLVVVAWSLIGAAVALVVRRITGSAGLSVAGDMLVGALGALIGATVTVIFEESGAPAWWIAVFAAILSAVLLSSLAGTVRRPFP